MAQHALPAALLLIVATEPALRLRLEWLERAGYRVRTACSLKEVDQACQGQIFDVVLIADSVEPRMKKAIGHAVRHISLKRRFCRWEESALTWMEIVLLPAIRAKACCNQYRTFSSAGTK